MAFTTLRPVGPAERYVDGFWEREGGGETVRVLPDGCMDFLFDLDEGTAFVVGAMNRAELVVSPHGTRLFGVRFLPGIASLFVDAIAEELSDGQVPLANVAAAFGTLGEQLAEADDTATRASTVTRFLQDARFRVRARDARVDRALSLIRRSHGSVSVARLAQEAGLGERQLERLFSDRVGVRPKVSCRVARLEHALRIAERSSPRRSQADFAVAAGYADESHLLREFRGLAGATPRDLLAERHVGFVQGAAGESR